MIRVSLLSVLLALGAAATASAAVAPTPAPNPDNCIVIFDVPMQSYTRGADNGNVYSRGFVLAAKDCPAIPTALLQNYAVTDEVPSLTVTAPSTATGPKVEQGKAMMLAFGKWLWRPEVQWTDYGPTRGKMSVYPDTAYFREVAQKRPGSPTVVLFDDRPTPTSTVRATTTAFWERVVGQCFDYRPEGITPLVTLSSTACKTWVKPL